MPGKENRQTAVVVEETYDFLLWLLPKMGKVGSYPLLMFERKPKDGASGMLPRRTVRNGIAPLVALVWCPA